MKRRRERDEDIERPALTSPTREQYNGSHHATESRHQSDLRVLRGHRDYDKVSGSEGRGEDERGERHRSLKYSPPKGQADRHEQGRFRERLQATRSDEEGSDRSYNTRHMAATMKSPGIAKHERPSESAMRAVPPRRRGWDNEHFPKEERLSADARDGRRDDRLSSDEGALSEKRSRLTVAELKAQREALFRQQFGYSNQDNPFGDIKLAEPFLWRKKLEMGQVGELKAEEYLAKTKMKLSEIDMVKQRRQEREREERLHEDYKATIARERDAESYEQWKKIEDDFFKSITQMRTMLRIKERREDVFDVLLKVLEVSRMVQFSDMRLPDLPPDEFLSKQTDDKLRETMDHIKVRLRIEKKEVLRMSLSDSDISLSKQELETNIAYWSALETIVKFVMADRERGVTRDTFKETRAKKRLTNKTLKELEEIERVINANLENPDETQDIHFNEMLQARIPYFKAVAYVTEVYKKAQEYAKKALGDEGGSELVDTHEEARQRPQTYSDEEDGYWSPRQFGEAQDSIEKWPAIEHLSIEEVEQDAEVTEWHFNLDDDGLLADEKQPAEEEDADLFFERFVQREKDLKQEDEIVLEGQEVEIVQPTANGELCRLRKPRYFNRVKTGFEWNRYNQTHYDQETPPPKVVQGYKFTISYPNLLEKGQSPTWRILPSETPNDGTVILLFSGGPPYEDLAFRIVNREWDCNPKRGFKNRFDHSILQLHFNFKRLRYRK